MKSIPTRVFKLDFLVRFCQKLGGKTSLLTNVGVIDHFVGPYQSDQIRSFSFWVLPGLYQSFGCTASTFSGQLTLNMTLYDDRFPKDIGQSRFDAMVTQLMDEDSLGEFVTVLI